METPALVTPGLRGNATALAGRSSPKITSVQVMRKSVRGCAMTDTRDETELSLLAIVASDFKLLDLAEKAGLEQRHFVGARHGDVLDWILYCCDSGDPDGFAQSHPDIDEVNELIAKLPRIADSTEADVRSLVRIVMGADKAGAQFDARGAHRKKSQEGHSSTSKRASPAKEVPREILWLNQVVLDGDLPANCCRVAYVIAQLWNAQSGDAWPSQTTVGAILHLDRTTIWRLTQPLVQRGHLNVKIGRGRGNTSRYRPIIKTPPIRLLISRQ